MVFASNATHSKVSSCLNASRSDSSAQSSSNDKLDAFGWGLIPAFSRENQSAHDSSEGTANVAPPSSTTPSPRTRSSVTNQAAIAMVSGVAWLILLRPPRRAPSSPGNAKVMWVTQAVPVVGSCERTSSNGVAAGDGSMGVVMVLSVANRGDSGISQAASSSPISETSPADQEQDRLQCHEALRQTGWHVTSRFHDGPPFLSAPSTRLRVKNATTLASTSATTRRSKPGAFVSNAEGATGDSKLECPAPGTLASSTQ